MTSENPPEGLNDEVEEPMRRHLDRDPSESPAEAPEADEDTAGYERAVEEGMVQPPSEQEDPGAGELAPEFQEPEQKYQ